MAGKTPKRRSSEAGADNERGGAYRAAVAAYVGVHALRARPIKELDMPTDADAVPLSILVESDYPVDDLFVELTGGRAYIQAKRTLGLSKPPTGPFYKTVQQWKDQVRNYPPDPTRDRLVVVSGEVSKPVRDLRDALNRGRQSVAAIRSSREEAAHKVLRDLIADLKPEQQERLIKCAVVWELNVESDTAPESVNAQGSLEGAVVPYGSGADAWDALCSRVRIAAGDRYGFDLEGLVRILRERPVPLVTDRDASAAAWIAARLEAVDRYRERVRRQGEHLDLLGLGTRLPPIPLAEADADLDIQVPTEDGTVDRSLPWTIRRRGRVTLLGLPGSGKTTMLRATAAEFARRPDWPVPVFVPLDKLSRRMNDQGFRSALLGLATEEFPPSDRELVREAIEEGLENGRVALFLDGLDEARERRFAVIEGLREFLGGVHEDVEIVIATRAVAYADAQTLNFAEASVAAPKRIMITVRKILEVAAERQGVPDLERATWVKARVRWVEDVLDTDSTLRETPLLPVLLTQVAIRHGGGPLPTTRATILRTLMEDVVSAWEVSAKKQGDVRIGALHGPRAVEALHRTFAIEASLLEDLGSLQRAEIEKAFAGGLAESFGLPPGEANAAANEAVAFWDETGVFVIAADGAVASRHRIFAEIGSAIQASRLHPPELGEWVRGAIRDESRWYCLVLACGIDGRICTEVWREILSRGAHPAVERIIMLLAQAVCDGAVLDSASMDQMIERLLGLLDDEDTSWQAAALLARLPVPQASRARVRESIATRSDPHEIPKLMALATLRWQESGAEATSILEETLRSVHTRKVAALKAKAARRRLRTLVRSEAPSRRSWVPGWPSKPPYSVSSPDVDAEVLIGAAERLRTHGPAALDLIAGALGGSSVRVDLALEHILVEEGRYEAVDAYNTKVLEPILFPRLSDPEANLDLTIVELLIAMGEPRPLTPRQIRRFDEIADFLGSIQLGTADWRSVADWMAGEKASAGELLHGFARLSGLDLDVIASQAGVLQEMLQGPDRLDAFFMVTDAGQDRGLTRWALVPDRKQLRNLLLSALGSYPWPAVQAANALVASPDPEETLDELEAALASYEPESRRLAGLVAMILDDQPIERARRWIRHEDVVIRKVAVERLAEALENGDDNVVEDLARALAEDEAGVCEAALVKVSADKVDESLLQRVRAWAIG